MGYRAVLIKLALALLALGMFGTLTGAKPASAAVTTVKMNLAGPAITNVVPYGYLTYTTDGTYKTLSANIFRINLAANTVVTLRSGTTVVGTMKIRVVKGGGNIHLDTRRGDTVPVITGSSAITVKKADLTLILSGPQTGARDFRMHASFTGPKLNGKVPAGSISYKETDYGYTRSLRVLAWNIDLAGSQIELYLNTNLLGTCTVTSGKVCIITETLLDSESVQHLTTSSVVKLKKKVGGAVVMTSQTWKTP
jgi:hypothetical protein